MRQPYPPNKIILLASLAALTGLPPALLQAAPPLYQSNLQPALKQPIQTDAASTIAIITQAINKKTKGYHNIVVYQFDSSHPLPQSVDGRIPDLPISNGWLIAINNASLAGDPEGGQYPMATRVYNGTANASSCANNANAQLSDGTKESWAIMTPGNVLAQLLGNNISPYVLFNANYFDTRPQKNNTTWQSNGCTLPLGVLYDNHEDNSTHNTYQAKNPYLAGPPSYIQPNGSLNPLQSYVIHDKNTITGVSPSFLDAVTFDLVENNSDDASDTSHFIDNPTQNYQELIAFSGTELLPHMNAGDGNSSQGPDTGGKATTRIAIGYKKSNDQLLIFEGGAYDNGVTRENLQQLFQALGANSALELDGGGSAAVAVRKDKVSWAGASTLAPDDENCHVANYVCTPITQPSGSARPDPAWVYFSFPSRGFTVLP